MLAFSAFPCLAQIDSTCSVSILNRTANIQPDGSYQIFNVPAGLGKARVRATCTDSAGNIRYGYSPYINILPDIGNGVGAVRFENLTPTLKSLSLTTPAAPLRALTDSAARLMAQARYSNDSTADVTRDPGITYRSTNLAIARVDSAGLVTAVSSGRVLILAMLERTLASAYVTVQIGNDQDGDGLPDDYELANSLNPTDPLDAREDSDLDGLTSLQEFQSGTNPRLADTDSDGIKDGEEVVPGKDGYVTHPTNPNTDGDPVPDGLEVEFNTDPTNPQSYNLAAVVSGIEVRPSTLHMVFNTALAQEVFRQLRVTGNLRSGGTIDLTDRALGTAYTSNNLQVANFGPESGRIYAGESGLAEITVRVGSHEVKVPVTIETFAPQVLTTMGLSGALTNVEVQGPVAYVTAGNDGLHILDVSNPAMPAVMATFNTPGFAYDLKVRDSIAYVADGASGLVLVNVSNPAQPVLLGTFDTPGTAQDIALKDSLAYIADGASGVQIINIARPSQLAMRATLNTQFAAHGVDADDSTIVVAEGNQGVELYAWQKNGDLVRFGRLITRNAQDVVMDRGYAFVADYDGSLRVVDPRSRLFPRIAASTSGTQAGFLLDLTVHKNILFGADIFFVNGVPLVDVSDPERPLGRTTLNFPGDATGVGVAADDQFVFMVADNNRLHVGQYARLIDAEGIPPSVEFITPAPGQLVVHGEKFTWEVRARDDVGVRNVSFQASGIEISRDPWSPFKSDVQAPTLGDSLTLSAQARDYGDNVSPLVTHRFQLGPDPGTTLSGKVVDRDSQVVAGASVRCGDSAWTTDGSGEFRKFYANTISGPISCRAELATNQWFGSTPVKKLVRGGLTDYGVLVLAPIPRVDLIQPRFVIGSGNKQMTVQGLNFLQGTTGFFKPMEAVNLPAPTVGINPQGNQAQLSVSIPANTAGSFVLVLTTSAGQSDTIPRGNNVFRVLANGNDDVDKDDLTNSQELLAGTDPLLVDTDGDGYGDGFEAAMGSNPLAAASTPVFLLFSEFAMSRIFSLASFRRVEVSSETLSTASGYFGLINRRKPDNPIDTASAASSYFGLLNQRRPPAGLDTLAAAASAYFGLLNSRNPESPRDTLSAQSLFFSLQNRRPPLTPEESALMTWEAHSRTWSLTNGIPAPPSGLVSEQYPDSDGDGLSDLQEVLIGTDPFDPDSDNDGQFDGLEVARGSNPLNGGSTSSGPVAEPVEESHSRPFSVGNQ